ncbi:zinc finger protein 571 [Bicyclus anynana]|uniref:Zinc finger protein 571 n=1 Tax=Bicyclus anynana TaxID=110368 RepID=A0A6J1NLV2_BICAN|nr:zinc finger protein 571 [Bicyclus anynana]
MDDSFIIANFHALCRLCLNKCNLTMSIFSTADDEANISLTSKIAECFELQMDPNDGLPARICYKCLFKLNKCSKFRSQCIQSEARLRQITNSVNELDNSNSSELSSFNYNNLQETQKPKAEDYIVEDSVVMVVDPSLDYDSSEDSDNVDQAEVETVERNNTPDGDTNSESFYKNVFMCKFCDQAFISQDKCKEHEHGFHDPNLPYKCVECSLVFAERTQYVAHTKQVHGSDKPYHCPECDKCFGRRSDLRKHSIVHTGVRPFQCQYCLKSFSRNTNLSKHLRIHAGHKPHVCPLCPRSFVAKGDLQRHVLVHSGMKPYACRKCPLTFGRRDKLIKHEVKHGPISPEHKAYENDQETHDMVVNVNPFNNLMTSPSQLNSSNANANDYDLPRVPDHIAGEGSFISQMQKNPSTSGKRIHNSPSKQKVTTPTKNRPKNIKCHQCPKRFASLDAYKTHVSIAHIGSRVFQCKICFKKFSRKRELDRHVTIHSGMKPFSCSQCDKKFVRKDKLDKHEQMHECLVVNMPCIECGATFEKKADLVAHIKSHFTDNFDEKISNTEIKKENEPDFPMEDNFYDET